MSSLLIRPIRFAALTLAMVAAMSLLLPGRAQGQPPPAQHQIAANASPRPAGWQPPANTPTAKAATP